MLLESKQFYVILFLAAASLQTALAGWAYFNQTKRGSRAFIGVALGCAIWSYGSMFQLIAPTWPLRILAMKLEITGVYLIPAAWLIFTLRFTNNDHLITDRVKYAAIGYFVFFSTMAWFNELHWLLWGNYTFLTQPFPIIAKDNRILYWAAFAIGYGGMFSGLGYIVRLSFTSGRPYRSQAFALTLGILSSMAANLISSTGILPIKEVDLSPVGLAIFALLMLGAIYRFRFLDLAPIARRTILDEIDDAVIVLNDDDRIADTNELGRQLLEMSEYDDVLGINAEDALPDDVYQQYATPNDSDTPETVEITVDGETRYYSLSTTAITSDGDVVGESILLRDVTELKEQEDNLRRQNDRLEEFASTVSHDLRNPLNIAQAYTDMARDDPQDDHFDTVEDSLDRMNQIIDDVLTLAREGQTVSEPAPVSLSTIASESWDRVETDTATLKVEVDKTILADRTGLYSIMENLYRNAVEHNNGDVTVTVGWLSKDEATGFYIADTGSGIPEEKRDEVLEHGVTTSDDGTGLGLSIVNGIAEAHGWTVSVTESESGGARFEFRGVELAD